MKNNKLIVSIGSTAYNEEENIKYFLKSICGQEEKNILIKEIILISDGSTDKTVEEMKKIKDRRIKIINFKQRGGKPTRVNHLFKIFKGEVLVVLDSDSILKDRYVIERLVAGFKAKEKNIGIIAGNPLPYPAKTFLEDAINNFILGRNRYVEEFNYADTAYIARGSLAYSRKLTNELRFPANNLNEDAYAYLYSITHGYKVFFVKEAVIWYRSPQIIKDHLNQATRHYAGGLQLKKYFPQVLVEKKFRLPRKIMLKILLYQLIRNPLGYLLLKILNIYCSKRSNLLLNKIDIRWKRITTSKFILA